KWREN
ncbi:hypothetical protein EC881467_1536, partial [Escherichia coli 88.1467]